MSSFRGVSFYQPETERKTPKQQWTLETPRHANMQPPSLLLPFSPLLPMQSPSQDGNGSLSSLVISNRRQIIQNNLNILYSFLSPPLIRYRSLKCQPLSLPTPCARKGLILQTKDTADRKKITCMYVRSCQSHTSQTTTRSFP